MRTSRRTFISCASLAAAGNLLGLRPFGALNALAAGSGGYKALVCVFLFGGNDANNTLIPFDTTGYGQYSSLRGDLALAQNTLLPLTPAPNFALHPSLPDIQTLFNSSNAAFVANVGTLVQPLTRAQYQAGQTAPTNLFSHPDQQLEWQNAAQSAATPTGWAGRMADVLGASYNQGASIPMITSVAGDTLFCNGVTISFRNQCYGGGNRRTECRTSLSSLNRRAIPDGGDALHDTGAGRRAAADAHRGLLAGGLAAGDLHAVAVDQTERAIDHSGEVGFEIDRALVEADRFRIRPGKHRSFGRDQVGHYHSRRVDFMYRRGEFGHVLVGIERLDAARQRLHQLAAPAARGVLRAQHEELRRDPAAQAALDALRDAGAGFGAQPVQRTAQRRGTGEDREPTGWRRNPCR